MRDPLFDEAHSAVAVAIAESYLCQPPDMTWEDRTDELASAAIEAMQIFIQMQREGHLYAGSKPLVETTEELARCEAREPDHVHPKAGQHD